MLFETRRHRLRRERLEAGFPDEWRDLCERRFRWWGALSAPERERLEQLTLRMVVDTTWEAARDFTLTDEILVTISAQACLLLLGLPYGGYSRVRSVIVHPTTLVVTGEHSQVPGIVSDSPMPVLGQAVDRGPVLVAWDEVLDDARHPGRSTNVVFHEFAHQLDMLDGTTDGTPVITDPDEYRRWVDVCTRTYREVEAGGGGRSLRPYAGVNPGEFFAVATEAFFDGPRTLRSEHPELYGVLADFYRQDPASWPGA